MTFYFAWSDLLRRPSYSQYDFIVKQTLAFLPIRHVDRNEIVKILIVTRIKKMCQFMQNNIFYAGNGCLVEIVIQVYCMVSSTATAPKSLHFAYH